jgi:hypothetical protein
MLVTCLIIITPRPKYECGWCSKPQEVGETLIRHTHSKLADKAAILDPPTLFKLRPSSAGVWESAGFKYSTPRTRKATKAAQNAQLQV